MLKWLYLALSVAGAAWTWLHNLRFIRLHDGFPLGMFLAESSANPAAASLAADITIAALTGTVLILVEGRRLRMRHTWIYVALTFGVAFACAFPLFLFMRERQLDR